MTDSSTPLSTGPADAATVPTAVEEPPRPPARGPIDWIRQNLFGSVVDSIVTIVLGGLVLWMAWGLIEWGLLRATWQADTAEVCRKAADGACWAFIGEKYRFILFGTYPYNEQWRPALTCIMIVAMLLASCDRRMWNWRLLVMWAIGFAAGWILMFGGVFGLSYVETTRWGGLAVTLVLSVLALAGAFPLSILLALGRRSNLAFVKAICVGFIELIRGVPLVSLLFMASVMLPLFLPQGMTIDKLLRAVVGLMLFAAAYLAEVIRGGLQAIPKGQAEAADALGLNYVQKTRMIILPQALRMVIPPLVNTFIGFFKDTSLVYIIGIFDLLTAAEAMIKDPAWRGFANETYLFTAAIYFVFCYSMSRYSRYLEQDLNKSRNR